MKRAIVSEETAAVLREAHCSGCGAALYKISDEGVVSKGQPFAAHVVSRHRDVDGAGGAVTLPSGRVMYATEIPQACSRACVRKIAATYAVRDLGAPIPGGYSMDVDDEVLVVLWNDHIPENPS